MKRRDLIILAILLVGGYSILAEDDTTTSHPSPPTSQSESQTTPKHTTSLLSVKSQFSDAQEQRYQKSLTDNLVLRRSETGDWKREPWSHGSIRINPKKYIPVLTKKTKN